jgi:acid phosphatase type 7
VDDSADSPRSFDRPRPSASEQLSGLAARPPAQVEQPLPQPTGGEPYRLDLAAVIGEATVGAITAAGAISFHTVGDTGGIKSPEYQEIVAQRMEQDATVAQPPISFFYHLGDVVYYDGEQPLYYDQFYEPYGHYPAPIFAIPGNHDGDRAAAAAPASLAGFMANFCAPSPVHRDEARDNPRTAMTQPNCYWTLIAPFLTIIGLYTNCPEHGVVGPEQEQWFQSELAAAPADKALIVALHHPPYSADSHHGASLAMRTLLEGSFAAAKRTPDLVLTGHVHNYQRFTRPLDSGAALTYIVAGAGGYWNLHYMAHVDGAPPPFGWVDPETGVTLASYNQEHRHGFLRLTVSASEISGVYTTVPNPQESWTTGPSTPIDEFTIAIGER